jgi:hypothetical protein
MTTLTEETGARISRIHHTRTGRLDKQRQEAILRKLTDKESSHLQDLLRTINTAQTDYSDAIKAVAEACGCKANIVNSYVRAIVADRLEEKKREIAQLSFMFDDQPRLF